MYELNQLILRYVYKLCYGDRNGNCITTAFQMENFAVLTLTSNSNCYMEMKSVV